MGSKALLLLRGTGTAATTSDIFLSFRRGSFSKKALIGKRSPRNYSIRSTLEPPDVPRLAQTARISLTPDEVEEFAPKIKQVIDWLGQLQAVDLQTVEPAMRAGTERESLRNDLPETFENWEAMIGAVPSYEEPYIKVPKVLNKE